MLMLRCRRPPVGPGAGKRQWRRRLPPDPQLSVPSGARRSHRRTALGRRPLRASATPPREPVQNDRRRNHSWTGTVWRGTTPRRPGATAPHPSRDSPPGPPSCVARASSPSPSAGRRSATPKAASNLKPYSAPPPRLTQVKSSSGLSCAGPPQAERSPSRRRGTRPSCRFSSLGPPWLPTPCSNIIPSSATPPLRSTNRCRPSWTPSPWRDSAFGRRQSVDDCGPAPPMCGKSPPSGGTGWRILPLAPLESRKLRPSGPLHTAARPCDLDRLTRTCRGDCFTSPSVRCFALRPARGAPEFR